MDSRNLKQCGFNGWHPLNNPLIASLPYKQKCVYVITLETVQRVRVGNSDILYIGSSDNLVRRIFGNYIGGVGGKTTQRIHKLLFEEGYLKKTKIGWITTENSGKIERNLRIKFKQEHSELPPWNRQL
jgi:hypothetical protein